MARHHGSSAPHPDDSRKPDSPTELTKPSWGYTLRKTLREFGHDQCTDLAAALTYYAVLAIFPAAIALISLLGVFGQGQSTVDTLLEILGGLAPESTVDTVRPVLENLVNSQGAGLGLIIGLAGALWSASGYVGAFSRVMNRVYEVEEGRPFWKLRPMQLIVTVIALVLVAAALFILIVSGPVAQTIGDVVGLGSTAVTVWSIAKWPVLALVVVLVIAILYYATPNVKQPKFRWLSMGSFIAIAVWLLASVAFAFYVANFGSYNKTYGSLAGVVIALLWIWITNLALLFGAEFDAETERSRELQAGIAAEETVQLPARDTRKSDKAADKRAEDVEKGRALRLSHGEEDDPDEVGSAAGSARRDGR